MLPFHDLSFFQFVKTLYISQEDVNVPKEGFFACDGEWDEFRKFLQVMTKQANEKHPAFSSNNQNIFNYIAIEIDLFGPFPRVNFWWREVAVHWCFAFWEFCEITKKYSRRCYTLKLQTWNSQKRRSSFEFETIRRTPPLFPPPPPLLAFVQWQQWIHLKNEWNLFKVNNKDTRMTSQFFSVSCQRLNLADEDLITFKRQRIPFRPKAWNNNGRREKKLMTLRVKWKLTAKVLLEKKNNFIRWSSY